MGPLVRSTVLLLVAFSITGFSPLLCIAMYIQPTLADSQDVSAQRIIGGQEVQPYSVKYQVSLQYEGYHYCGGTLVHAEWVVSAAHCWRPSNLMKVVLSEHDLNIVEGFEQVFNVNKTFVHTAYIHNSNFNNDIMLIKLSTPAMLHANAQPVQLPEENSPQLRGDSRCMVSGWGVTQIYSYVLTPVLRAWDVFIKPDCRYYYWGRITPNMLCAGSPHGGKDSCQGDSGGPLVCNGYFEGIVSWGINCVNPYYPGVYTKVRQYTTWINSIIDNDNRNGLVDRGK